MKRINAAQRQPHHDQQPSPPQGDSSNTDASTAAAAPNNKRNSSSTYVALIIGEIGQQQQQAAVGDVGADSNNKMQLRWRCTLSMLGKVAVGIILVGLWIWRTEHVLRQVHLLRTAASQPSTTTTTISTVATEQQQQQTPSLLRNNKNKSNRKLKTLVVLMGGLRCGELAWQTLYDNVLDLPENNAPDLAVLTNTAIPPKFEAASLFQRARYLWHVPDHSDWADALDAMHGSDASWRAPLYDVWRPSNGNILLGPLNHTIGSGTIIFTFRWYLSQYIRTLNLTETYDRFVITRSDHYYVCPHSLDLLDNQYLWIPSGEDWGGICDRHLIANKDDILPALNILPPILENPYQYRHALGRKVSNTEQIVLQRWFEEGLTPRIRRFRRPMFLCTDALDMNRTHYFVQEEKEVQAEGVYTKYHGEYHRSHRNCRQGPHIRAWLGKAAHRKWLTRDFLSREDAGTLLANAIVKIVTPELAFRNNATLPQRYSGGTSSTTSSRINTKSLTGTKTTTTTSREIQ
jgi:hypothetical protein